MVWQPVALLPEPLLQGCGDREDAVGPLGVFFVVAPETPADEADLHRAYVARRAIDPN